MAILACCLLIGAFIVSTESSQYNFVLAPNVIRFDHDETITVSIFGTDRNVAITVWFEHRDKQISTKTVTVTNQTKPVQTTVRVTENDLFDSVIDEKPRLLKLCSRRESNPKICRNIVLSYKTGYLIVQTDKPIYTPLQKVKIRVLALDESLKKVSGDKWQISMDIVSPSNMTLGRRVFTTTKASGFYTNHFSLPPYPEIGLWTARAFYMGQFETLSRATFQVEEYVLPTFGVSIDVSEPYILQSVEKTITITVQAKYVYGKPVTGSARLTLNVTDSMGDSKYLLDMSKKGLENGISEFSVKISEILATDALNNEFPGSSRLLIVATVFESATGKEESIYHSDTVFATDPYIFKFTRSKKHFRPGMEYYLKVDLLTPNNQRASDIEVKVQKLDHNNVLLQEEKATTDTKGRALTVFSAPKLDVLKFKVIISSVPQESEILTVSAYNDKNQIQVEHIITDDNTMLMRAFTNVQLEATSGSSYTGMLFVIVTRGKVVETVFKPASNKDSIQIEEKLQKLINPTARLLVMYVDEVTNKVVADSIKIEVEPKCRDELTIKPDRVQVVPGEGDKLTVTGTPYMWVGLNVMDKALLLLNNKNIMRKSQMFEELSSHDLGCGEGSGRNNGDVFKNAGLTIITDARVESDVDRISEDCDAKKRKRRSTNDCYGADEQCCSYGKWYAKKVFDEHATDEEKAKLDSYVFCYATARKLAIGENHKLLTKCILAVLYTCKEELDTLISDITQIVSKSLDDISDYASDLELLAQHQLKPHKRTDFRESFLFEELHLNNEGTAVKEYTYPDSITEWMIQAIGISENNGTCIADPVDVKVFRQFFVQLDLPYKATRLELFDVKASLFNYGLETDKEKHANMYLEGANGICYGSKDGKVSPRQSLDIGPNSAHTLRFPVLPLRAGLFSVTVSAIVVNLGIPQVDIIEKKLFVVNEGIQEIITIQVCLDPNQQREDCEDHKRVTTQYIGSITREQISKVDLTLPETALLGTGSATAYIQGDIMDNVIKTILSGVDSLFRKPYGCVEQTIASTAPNVYAMMYLKQTNQVTSDIEVKGNTNIRNGVNRQKSMFKRSDGSYSAYSSTFSSVWLTAFVAKVFCQAKTVVDDVLDERADLHQTISFLNSHVNSNGQFNEIQEIWSGQRLMGSMDKGSTPSLTSFVLISLLECNILPRTLNRTIDLAINYVENLNRNWLRSRPFDLAISTYALAMAKSNKADDFKNLLLSIKKTMGKNIYWGNTNIGKADAYTVETTAYALLAMLQFNDLKTAAYIVRWLTLQQDVYGVFKSTQDTVVGLQALSQYSIRTHSPDVDLKVSMVASGWRGEQLPVKNEKFKLQQIIRDLPVEKGDNKVTVSVAGTSGSGRMRIELRYNRPAEDDEICPFNLTEIEVDDVYEHPIDHNIAILRQCDVCGRCAADPDSPDYDTLTTLGPDNSSRRKRQAASDGKQVDNMKCIRFSVNAKEGHQHGMSMIYFNLETGVQVLQEDMKNLMLQNDNLDDFEMPKNEKGFVVFYLNTMTSHENIFVFRLIDTFEGDINTRQPVSVDVFDYYSPDKYCRKIYGTGPNRGASIDYTCDSTKAQCNCLQSACSQSQDAYLSKLIQQRKKPALKLFRYTCNPEKANYAVFVTVTALADKDPKNKMAAGTVIRSIHQGGGKLEKNDEMTFFWKTSCAFPDLKVGKKYYIIAKDGHAVEGKDGNPEYLYPLMNTAVVIEQPSGTMKRMMNHYERLMKSQGCQN